jgi:putative DNA primase/helicase
VADEEQGAPSEEISPRARALADPQSPARPEWYASIMGHMRPVNAERERIECRDRPVHQIAEQALDALLCDNDPFALYQPGLGKVRDPDLYNHAGRLVSLVHRPGSPPVLHELNTLDLKGWLDLICTWTRTRNHVVSCCGCPFEVANLLMARRPWTGFPRLTGIVTAPSYSSSGTLHHVAGYEISTQLFYAPLGVYIKAPELKGDAEPLAVAEALEPARTLLLDELLGDFPFADESSRAHALALVLLPFVRAMIPGPTPLHLIDAPLPGSGKSLLADACTRLFVPHGVPVTTAPAEGEEWRKKITAALSTGRSHLWFDNLPRRLASAELAAALTAEYWEDRMLGQSTMVEYPSRCAWLATANNVRASDEIGRRSVWIRLDPRVEQPWKRGGFKHDPLVSWVLAERPRLVQAALTLVQAWIAEGKPKASVRFGSFQSWAEVMGGILAVAAVPGFLANQDELLERADELRGELRQFVALWAATFGTAPVGVVDLYRLLGEGELLAERLGDGTERSRKTKLGKLLAQHEDQLVGDWRIVRAGRRHQTTQYQLVPAGDVAGDVA